VAGFDGGAITSDAGTLLLGATDRAIGLIGRFAACFIDRRKAELVEHLVATLIGQRMFRLALGGRRCASFCAPIHGFARDALMTWCEANVVDFIFGLAKNVRLNRAIGAALAMAGKESRTTGQPARRFKELTWSTRKSWSRARRVIATAEWTQIRAR
jgi:hypothetical protein